MRRFRWRLWFVFFAALALTGLGTLVLSLGSWSPLSAFGVGLGLTVLVTLIVRFAIGRLAENAAGPEDPTVGGGTCHVHDFAAPPMVDSVRPGADSRHRHARQFFKSIQGSLG